MAHSFRSHYFHLIWSTKERRNCITDEIRPRLYAYMGGIIRKNEGTLLRIGGTSNHVHLLITINVIDKFTQVVRELKCKSSLWVHQNFPDQDFAWQDGFGSFSVSYLASDKVIQYIDNQEEHHKIFTFEEELAKILKNNNIKCDEKYMFG